MSLYTFSQGCFVYKQSKWRTVHLILWGMQVSNCSTVSDIYLITEAMFLGKEFIRSFQLSLRLWVCLVSLSHCPLLSDRYTESLSARKARKDRIVQPDSRQVAVFREATEHGTLRVHVEPVRVWTNPRPWLCLRLKLTPVLLFGYTGTSTFQGGITFERSLL